MVLEPYDVCRYRSTSSGEDLLNTHMTTRGAFLVFVLGALGTAVFLWQSKQLAGVLAINGTALLIAFGTRRTWLKWTNDDWQKVLTGGAFGVLLAGTLAWSTLTFDGPAKLSSDSRPKTTADGLGVISYPDKSVPSPTKN